MLSKSVGVFYLLMLYISVNAERIWVKLRPSSSWAFYLPTFIPGVCSPIIEKFRYLVK